MSEETLGRLTGGRSVDFSAGADAVDPTATRPFSNLPTVWTNVLAAVILAGADWRDWRVAIVLAAMSLFYVGGMYLNDFFDRAIDANERPERPIPSGAIAAGCVAAVGFALITV